MAPREYNIFDKKHSLKKESQLATKLTVNRNSFNFENKGSFNFENNNHNFIFEQLQKEETDQIFKQPSSYT